MICGLLLVIPGLVIPTFTRIFIDDYLVGSQEWIVRPLLWFMAATIVIQAVLTWLQQLLPAAARDQAGARHVEPLLQPHPAAAGRLLRPALRRRDRLARRDQRQGRQDHRRPAGDHDHRQRPDDLLRDADVPLRRQADAGGAAAVGLLNIAAVKAASRARTDASRRLQAGPRQAAGHGDERSPDDRDPQGDRLRGRVLRPLGRLLRQVDQHHAAARRARPDRRRGAAVRADR